ncbi:MAG: FAD:protein FMN transferase [Deltaproteobacteria bacterium]|nr:FAD:protein FMN transferase [Deltaproteobacteria bacterium]
MGPLLFLAACAHPPGDNNTRVSRPGAGTIVGITVRRDTDPALVDGAFAALAAWEARYSEWNPGSITSRATTSPQDLDAEGLALFRYAGWLHDASGGAFDIGWRGATWSVRGDQLTASGPLDLGGLLKGFLADRAADSLRAAGVGDFAVDVGGDVVVEGEARPGSGGWPVDVAVGGTIRTVTVIEALSTSSQEQQPGHVVDARDGKAASTLAGVYVTARTGLEADGLATAVLASGGGIEPPPGARVCVVGAEGGDTCGE